MCGKISNLDFGFCARYAITIKMPEIMILNFLKHSSVCKKESSILVTPRPYMHTFILSLLFNNIIQAPHQLITNYCLIIRYISGNELRLQEKEQLRTLTQDKRKIPIK